MTKNPDKSDNNWAGKAALAAALLYASNRKERAEKAAKAPKPDEAPETD